MKRRQPRQSRSKATVTAILDASALILSRHDLPSITTNHIAEVAGVSIGTLYQYFSNKQAIFDALYNRYFDSVAVEVRAALTQSTHTSLEEMVVQLTTAVIEVRLKQLDAYLFLLSHVPRRQHTIEQANRLSDEFKHAVWPYRHELKPKSDFDCFVFVLSQMIEGLSKGLLISKPAELDFDAALEESLAALRAYISSHRR